jgi:cobalt/nickel transport system permease protein
MSPQELGARVGWLGHRDDRARLLAFFLIALAWASLTSLPGGASALALALLIAGASGLGLWHVVRRLKPVLSLLCLLLLLTPFWHPPGAQPLVAAWTWGPSDLGLASAGLLSLRVLALSALAIAVLDVAPFDQSLQGLRGLGVPAPLVHTALLTQRALVRFQEDLARIEAALRVRGFRARGLGALPTYAGVAGGLLVRSVERAERLEQAMRCRGYQGELMLPAPPQASWRDGALILGAALLALAFPLAERWPW